MLDRGNAGWLVAVIFSAGIALEGPVLPVAGQ
jgi:hypothetical protein